MSIVCGGSHIEVNSKMGVMITATAAKTTRLEITSFFLRTNVYLKIKSKKFKKKTIKSTL